MICQRCKGKGWAIVLVKQKEGFYHTEQAECPECHGKGFVEQTNEEWIRSCTREELIEVLYNVWAKGFPNFMPRSFLKKEVKKQIRLWLKEKHK